MTEVSIHDANDYQLACHIKAHYPRNVAYNQYVICLSLQPRIDLKDFMRLYDIAEPKSLRDVVLRTSPTGKRVTHRLHYLYPDKQGRFLCIDVHSVSCAGEVLKYAEPLTGMQCSTHVSSLLCIQYLNGLGEPLLEAYMSSVPGLFSGYEADCELIRRQQIGLDNLSEL